MCKDRPFPRWAPDFGPARFGNRNYEAVMRMRAVFVGGEIRAQQAHAGDALVLPIGCMISGVSARHLSKPPPFPIPPPPACWRRIIAPMRR
jgi:hypothetical protein